MRYEHSSDLNERISDIVSVLSLDYIDLSKIASFRSYGTNSRRVIARCHGLPKVMQLGLKTEPFYVIEVISERFDKMSYEDQTKVLIHEILHIPKSFGGGFRQHDFVNRKTVEMIYRQYKQLKEKETSPIQTEEKEGRTFGIMEQIIQSFSMNDKE